MMNSIDAIKGFIMDHKLLVINAGSYTATFAHDIFIGADLILSPLLKLFCIVTSIITMARFYYYLKDRRKKI